jgi:NADPH:quinone reductase-like Zn-dependent oxidoreductase
MRAVRFDRFGDETVLKVLEVDDPVPAAGEVLVRVRAAAINPGEIYIRQGLLEGMFPTTFPSGQGSDVAGDILRCGPGVQEFAVGDQVLGWSDERRSHAELVVLPVNQVIAKPPSLSWEVAGSMFIAPMAALAGVRSVDPRPGETVAVSGAAGGVGSVAVQLAHRTGATVIGIASPSNHEWLRDQGIIPVSYGDGQQERLIEAAGGQLDAMIDTFGDGYVELALSLGVSPTRINTIIDMAAVQKHGVSFQGSAEVGTTENLAIVAELAATGQLDIPIARTYPLDDVRDAYRQLAERHTHGKVVLLP